MKSKLLLASLMFTVCVSSCIDDEDETHHGRFGLPIIPTIEQYGLVVDTITVSFDTTTHKCNGTNIYYHYEQRKLRMSSKEDTCDAYEPIKWNDDKCVFQVRHINYDRITKKVYGFTYSIKEK